MRSDNHVAPECTAFQLFRISAPLRSKSQSKLIARIERPCHHQTTKRKLLTDYSGRLILAKDCSKIARLNATQQSS